jgi:hypothetical protein
MGVEATRVDHVWVAWKDGDDRRYASGRPFSEAFRIRRPSLAPAASLPDGRALEEAGRNGARG